MRVNPIDVFGDSLQPLLYDMIKQARKCEESISRDYDLVRLRLKGKPKWWIMTVAENLNIPYEEYWNQRALNNLGRWYTRATRDTTSDWELAYEFAKEARIEDVAGSLFPKGTNRPIKCPFHEDGTPSFRINPERNIYKCFGCNAGGSPIDFIMQYHNLDFKDAVKFMYNKY